MESNESVPSRPGRPGRRRYELRERARRRDETRRRITEAAVELHATVGPARTTVTELARRAGVGRMTVYNHFPTDEDLLRACSAHWAAENPPPDPGSWERVSDPAERLRVALGELYPWYRRNEGVLGNSIRDAGLVPAVADLMRERWEPAVDRMVGALVAGRGLRGPRRRRAGAALRLALDLGTWRALTRDGVDDAEAADLAAEFVEAACARGGRGAART